MKMMIKLPSAQKQGAYHIKLKNILNTQYVGKIAIGEENNFFDVIFDTGMPQISIFSLFQARRISGSTRKSAASVNANAGSSMIQKSRRILSRSIRESTSSLGRG
jgi:hypothetical protein